MVAFLPPSRSFGIFNSRVVRVERISLKLSITAYSLSSKNHSLLLLRENTLVAGHARAATACCSQSALTYIFLAPLKDVLFGGLRLYVWAKAQLPWLSERAEEGEGRGG